MSIRDALHGGEAYGAAWEVASSWIYETATTRLFHACPGLPDDDTLNLRETDDSWRHLLFARTESGAFETMGVEVQVGRPLFVHSGMTDWWRTSPVVSIRRLADDKVPAPVL